MSSKKKVKVPVERNWVAKNDHNVGGAHEVKTKYSRRTKHRRGGDLVE